MFLNGIKEKYILCMQELEYSRKREEEKGLNRKKKYIRHLKDKAALWTATYCVPAAHSNQTTNQGGLLHLIISYKTTHYYLGSFSLINYVVLC